MPHLSDIQTRLYQGLASYDALQRAVLQQLEQQHFCAEFNAEQVAQWSAEFSLSAKQIALKCLPLAACYARTPVSHFFVGAVAIGQSGKLYFGANQEFEGQAIQHSVHAEQSAISHAWLAGEPGISDIAVNYTPCGHCRQFMNELNTARSLHIHLPHSQQNLLSSYLPDAFGPQDLAVDRLLFDPQHHGFHAEGDALTCAAIEAANQAYAPYSKAVSGVALQVNGQIICGRYAENAAFNPSFLPLQSALNLCRLSGISLERVERVLLAEKQAVLSHRKMTEALANTLLGVQLEYVALK